MCEFIMHLVQYVYSSMTWLYYKLLGSDFNTPCIYEYIKILSDKQII